jgi:hypothetical protein
MPVIRFCHTLNHRALHGCSAPETSRVSAAFTFGFSVCLSGSPARFTISFDDNDYRVIFSSLFAEVFVDLDDS